MRHVLLIVISVALILGLACGKKAEDSAEEAAERTSEVALGEEASVDISDEGYAMTSVDEEGSYSMQAGDKATIPAGFPSDFYVYEGAEIATSVDSPEGFIVSLRTDDPVERVVEVYKEKLTGAGWTEQSTVDAAGIQMLMYGKGDRMAKVDVLSEEGVTAINLTASK
jgi:hypothetical protein